MPDFTITLPEPHAAQQQVTREAKRFNVLACGRRWGKTTLGVDRLIQPALKGLPTALFAPSYKNLAETWRETVRTLQKLISTKNQTERRIELITGGSIEFWSLDSPDVAESVRGRKYATAVVDEAATIRDLVEVWQRIIRPTLADLRGDAWFLSTPRGYNGFQSFHSRGEDPNRTEWASWRMPTSSNPFIEPDEIESMREEMTEASFAQEVLAEFITHEGAVFRRINEVALATVGRGPIIGHQYVIGADWGRSVDFTVFVVMDVTTRSMVAIDRSNRVDYAVQRERLRALRDHWRPTTILAEHNSIGQPICEQLIREGIRVRPFTTTNATKAQIIESLALAFERWNIAIIPDPVLLAELQAYQSEILPSGLTRYGAPAGMHDDTVIALALAWWECRRPKMRFGTEYIG